MLLLQPNFVFGKLSVQLHVALLFGLLDLEVELQDDQVVRVLLFYPLLLLLVWKHALLTHLS